MRRLRLAPEFGAGPIWDDEWDGKQEICPAPASLGLSASLAARLEDWQRQYDATLNDADPKASGFRSKPEARAWADRGRALFRDLQEELDGVAICRLVCPKAWPESVARRSRFPPQPRP